MINWISNVVEMALVRRIRQDHMLDPLYAGQKCGVLFGGTPHFYILSTFPIV